MEYIPVQHNFILRDKQNLTNINTKCNLREKVSRYLLCDESDIFLFRYILLSIK